MFRTLCAHHQGSKLYYTEGKKMTRREEDDEKGNGLCNVIASYAACAYRKGN